MQVCRRRRGLLLPPLQQQQLFIYLKALPCFTSMFTEKTQPLLVISANRPLLSNLLFHPSVCLSFCIPLKAHCQAPDPETGPARLQLEQRMELGLCHLIGTRRYEIHICLPCKHLGRAEPCRACSLAEPLPSISTFPIMS